MILPEIDRIYLQDFLVNFLNTPSPTGYAESAIAFTGEAFLKIPGLEIQRTPKGALLATWPGERNDAPRAITGHADTLGAMVKEIKPNGRLRLSALGGLQWSGVETEGCTVFTANGQQYRGALLINYASAHVHGKKTEETRRSDETMEVRLDVRSANADETRALGIAVGDYVAFDPRVEVVNDFVRSRFLDDKAGVACMVAAAKTLSDAGLIPLQTTHFYISNYEEVGHGGASFLVPEVAELLAVDMAALGEGQNSDEFHASLCVKDSSGPYHHGLCQRLRQLAERHQIAYRVDIYPYYGSDGSAYWRAGGSGAVALIGPGVDASHSYERTHMEALVATTQWIMAYLLS